MRNTVLAVMGAGAIGAFGICPLCLPAADAAAPSHAVGAEGGSFRADLVESRTVTLKVEGMTCGGCAISARLVLERLDGVEKAEVSHEKKLAIVTYEAEKVTPERMIAALAEGLRYTATVIEEKAS